ncbi:unnamed protein product [Plutella xylostella]|uniref:(diamondback moth) hypothetical protein n=1 Tax=Plutella xylostella TaxID=51655 RepID=A0A8S4F1Z6_PLUXY|nr:unnamed protein product [Plutella xylostella]
MTAIQTILLEELGVKKLVSRWVPHRLTEEQKSARVNWCRSALQRFNGGSSNDVYNIVSGDESWIYSYEPERKHQSAVWVFEAVQNERQPRNTATIRPETLRDMDQERALREAAVAVGVFG